MQTRIVTIMTVALLMLTVSTGVLQSQIESAHEPGQMIVHLKKNIATSSIEAAFGSHKLKAEKLLSRRLNIWLFSFDPNSPSEQEVLSLVASDSRVLAAQFNHYVTQRVQIPDDPQFGSQWALNNTGQSGGTPDADVDGPEAWDISTGGVTAAGDEIVVAIIDGGMDLNHQDLDLWKNVLEIPGNGIDDDNNGYIDDFDGWNAYSSNGNIPGDSHGTHVAGIAAAIGNNSIGVSGVNWGAKVLPVAGSSGVESIVVEAYGYVLELRATYNETSGAAGAFIVSTNSSFGVDFGNPANFPIWCAMYDSMGAAGILSAAATANLNIDIDVQGDVPTACPSDYMIAVTNTTRNDVKNSGAAFGATTIDLGAPGTSVLSTLPGNNYGNLTGTSMATPHVAGAIALMYAAASATAIQMYKSDPGLVALDFRDMLLQGVDPIVSLQGITVTGGRLNLYNSLLLVKDYFDADDDDPVPPGGLTLFSDYLTPTSVDLSWTDPDSLAGGGPLDSFVVEVFRDGNLVDSVPVGIMTYTDSGTTDGQEYFYSLRTRLVANDSVSLFTEELPVFSGGSPIPAPPTNLVCTADSVSAHLSWNRPLTQTDGTFLDDLAFYYVYRDQFLIDSTLSGSDTSLTDSPAPGFQYSYSVRAVDNEIPRNLSEASDTTNCLVGTDILGPEVVHTSPGFARIASLPVSISADVQDDLSSVASVDVEYEINGTPQSGFPMILTGGTTYSGTFGFGANDVEMGDAVTYRIKAEDGLGNQSVWPSTGSFEITVIDEIAADDFEGGSGNWTITNDGGTCVWAVIDISSNPYTMPPSASGNVLSADSDICGTGSSLLSTATLTQGWDLTGTEVVALSLDSDWRIFDADDEAILEASYDGGNNWETLLHYDGVSARNETLEFDISAGAAGKSDVRIRLISIQPGWDWWWTVDNIRIAADSGFVVGIGSRNGGLPTAFALHRNYPNPFNPTTTIRYDLRSDVNVSLKIYNVLGQEIRSLVSGFQQAGSRSVVWDGKNDFGRQVASGIYVYRIEAGKFRQTRKMMLLK